MAQVLPAIASVSSFLGPIATIFSAFNTFSGLFGGPEEDIDVSTPLPAALTTEDLGAIEADATQAVQAEEARFEGVAQATVEAERRRRLQQQQAFRPEGIGAVLLQDEEDTVDIGGGV